MANQRAILCCLIIAFSSQVLSDSKDLTDDVQNLLNNLNATVRAAIDGGIQTVQNLQGNTFVALNQKNIITLENLNKKNDVIKNNLTNISDLGDSAGVNTSTCFEEPGDIDNIIINTRDEITVCYEMVLNNLTKASNDSIYRIDVTVNDVEKLSSATDQCLSSQTTDACLKSLQTQLQDALTRIPLSIVQETVQAAQAILEASVPVDDCTQDVLDSEDIKIANILSEITDCVYDLINQ